MEPLGWIVAAVAVGRWVALRRRLTLVARAEHELRGPLTALLLALPPDAAGRLDTELARVRLGLADLAAARSGRRAPARVRQIEVGGVAATGDPDRVAQALGNLVANAREHGKEPVVVTAERRGRTVEIEVADAGPGVHGNGLKIAAAAARDSGGELRLSPAGFPVLHLKAAE
jgi:signal transduction histidine kinase